MCWGRAVCPVACRTDGTTPYPHARRIVGSQRDSRRIRVRQGGSSLESPVTLTQLDGNGASFSVALDTHSGSLCVGSRQERNAHGRRNPGGEPDLDGATTPAVTTVASRSRLPRPGNPAVTSRSPSPDSPRRSSSDGRHDRPTSPPRSASRAPRCPSFRVPHTMRR